MLLHESNDFVKVIRDVADINGIAVPVIEKDYYVTMILKLLAERAENCVFKGGTCLSKGFHVIDRFSEDIDITFSEYIGRSRRKKMKNEILKSISEDLNMPILNWDKTISKGDYNAYHFDYEPISTDAAGIDSASVKVEIVLMSYSFPTQKVKIGSYIGDYFKSIGDYESITKYELDEFEMSLQTLERTYIDKVYALCDYYLQKRNKRGSRHLYDIYKLTPLMNFNDEFRDLIRRVQEQRSGMEICPSAKEGVNISQIINEFCDNNYYKSDYETITRILCNEQIPYEETIKIMRMLAGSGMFSTQEKAESPVKMIL